MKNQFKLFEITYYNTLENRINSIVVSASKRTEAFQSFKLKYPMFRFVSIEKLY